MSRLSRNKQHPTSLDASPEEIKRTSAEIASFDRPEIPQSVSDLLTEIRELEERTQALEASPQLDKIQQVALPKSMREEILADMQIEADALLEDRDHELFDLTDRIDDEFTAAIERGDQHCAYYLGKALGDYYAKLGLLTAAISVYRLTSEFAVARFEATREFFNTLSPLDIERAFRKDNIPDEAMITGDTSLIKPRKRVRHGDKMEHLYEGMGRRMDEGYVEDGIEKHATWQKQRIIASASGRIVTIQLARTNLLRRLYTEDRKAFKDVVRSKHDGASLKDDLERLWNHVYYLEPIDDVDSAYRVVFNCHWLLGKIAPFYHIITRIGHKRACKRMSNFNYLASHSRSFFRPSGALIDKEIYLRRLGNSITIGFHFDESARLS